MITANKVCRECGGSEFFTKQVSARGSHGPDLLPIGFFALPKFQLRVCGGCGLVDWFVSPKYLADVRQKFTRVG